MPTRGGYVAMAGALAFAGCSVLTSGVLDDKDPTPTTSAGGSGEGGMVPVVTCEVADECPGIDTTCRFRVCEGGVCDFENAPASVGCTENAGLFCNGEGACVQCLDDDDCAGNDSCVAGICAPVHCTDGRRNMGETDEDCGGPCPPCDNGDGCGDFDDCTSGFCDQGTCAACGNDGDCAANAETYCDSGICAPKKVGGDECVAGTECASDVCADQVCCNEPCADCMGCRVGLTGVPNGTCAPITLDTDPHDSCEETSIPTCGTSGDCDGSGSCAVYGTNAVCSTKSCSNGSATFDGQCDGMGTCDAPSPASCGFFACNGNECHTSCTTNAQCAGTNACVNGQCRPCGQSPMNTGPCPNGCDNCIGGTCNIICDQGASGPCDGGVACPPGWSCVVNCQDAQSCANDTIDCPPDGRGCTVACTGGLSCQNSTINCGDGPCTVTCGGGDGCTNTSLVCGNNSCTAICGGQDVNASNTSASCSYMPSGC